MLEKPEALKREILALLEAIRQPAGGRYACLVEPKGILFESPEPEDRESWALRRLLEERAAGLLALPAALAGTGPADDVFAGWEHDELFVAVINERVALVVACPEAEPLKQAAQRPLRALADRLFRWDASYRMDRQGHGFFFGRAKLDLIVIGRAEG